MKSLPLIFLAFVIAALPALGAHGQDEKSKSETEVQRKAAEKQNSFEIVKSAPQLQFSVSLSPQDALPGDTVTLTIKTKIESGWHIYAMGDDGSVGGLATKIKVRSRSLEPLGDEFTPSEEPKDVTVGDEVQKHHEGEFSWTREYQVKPGVENYFASGSIKYQACEERRCLPPARVKFSVGLKPGEEPVFRGPPKAVARKASHPTIGEPVVVTLEDCEATRPKVKFSMSDIFSGGTSKDELVLRGSLSVDGKKTDFYLPKSRRYKLTNSGYDETRFSNDSTYLSLDHDGDGTLVESEHSACNRPIRVLDSMYQVTGIEAAKKTMTFQQVDVPLSGAIVGRRCPEFEYTTVDGKKITNESILGKVTLLDIWAVT